MFSDSLGVLRLPGSGDIPLSDRLAKVVDHPAFQRLREVRQLGSTHLVFPGAVHTRFEHALGVTATAQWFWDSLQRDPDFSVSVGEVDRLALIAGALLHDLGHTPYAHNFEALHYKGGGIAAPAHEEIGARVILWGTDERELSPSEGILKEVLTAKEVPWLLNEAGESIGQLLERDWGIEPSRVAALVTGDFASYGHDTPVNRLLRSILSGGIDADKMDYLWRDSHHLGIPYGKGYDRERLLGSVIANESGTKIAFEAKGKVPAEAFIFARYMMFSEVYWHHTNRAVSAMIERAMWPRDFMDKGGQDDLFRQMLHLGDDALLQWLTREAPKGRGSRGILEGLVGRRRRIYKRLATYSTAYQEVAKQEAYQRLYRADAWQVSEFLLYLSELVSARLGRRIDATQLIVDTPPRDKDRLERVEVYYEKAAGRQWYPLDELSRIVGGVGDDFIRVVKKIRLFGDPEIVEKLRIWKDLDEWLLESILGCDML